MICSFCGRDISSDRFFKRGTITPHIGDGKAEKKVFCDGPSASEAMLAGLDISFISLVPSEQEIQKYAKIGLCAQVYKFAKAIEGFSIIIEKITRK